MLRPLYTGRIENEAVLASELVWTVLEKKSSVSAEKQTPGCNQFTLQITLYHIISFVNYILLNIRFR